MVWCSTMSSGGRRMDGRTALGCLLDQQCSCSLCPDRPRRAWPTSSPWSPAFDRHCIDQQQTMVTASHLCGGHLPLGPKRDRHPSQRSGSTLRCGVADCLLAGNCSVMFGSGAVPPMDEGRMVASGSSLYCYFLLYFFLRFAAHDKKLAFSWSVMSLVDYFTVPPTFVAIGLDRNWFGLRYLRVLNLLWLVDLARATGLLANLLAIKFARLFLYIMTGTFLLLECSATPGTLHDNTLQQKTTFWNFAYFSVITISTVGYGDMSTKTILGNIFCCLYMFACLV
ncbi:hypothetical protein RvY_03358-2 [Ramazzottius varieornatus]|uniref:Potassium channel domain-containing protein n=1 Tax=Ramazzottius varieornatus TaxID=947166 RepID=A0A1D1UMU0_RAMVA|nr:hypothetical protein RvY_03358-2 [Ramazzottius varieornatus]